ncbi:type IV secretion protein Rhs [Citrobacter sp. Awk 4]|uniref:type IV secretion protein Rhs n=1 Tax=Citrobacter sp. Awk 4 TaxID=2963955 RepID=UPI002303C02C|nr:type IV secretion protein Rhs [Citrobacter sp. Awk 4]MDA8480954.1 type IV secretion protein Rhs [Citrobacter sp. Awk 4]
MNYPYPNSISWPETHEGGIRRLRLGEINLASSLYGSSIRYNLVWIHLESYLPFDLQNPRQAMSPNGEMWFRSELYQKDFSLVGVYYQHLFLHEMMHVWQHQRGMMVRTRGLFSWAADYSYHLDKSSLLDYSLEQQASIVSDYWVLVHHGFNQSPAIIQYCDYDPSVPEHLLIEQYKKVLGGFPTC